MGFLPCVEHVEGTSYRASKVMETPEPCRDPNLMDLMHPKAPETSPWGISVPRDSLPAPPKHHGHPPGFIHQ